MLGRIERAIKKLVASKRGSSPVVSFVILAPLILVVAFGISWLGHMADAQNVVEEAARAGARWLAAHPGDIDGAKARAAEVVEGAIGGKYIVGGSIDNPGMNGKLVGKLVKAGNHYVIVDRNYGSVRVKPANSGVKATMDGLLNRTVVADGSWNSYDTFKVKVATTNPPEAQTVNQTVPNQGSSGGGGTSGSLTVNQTRHPGPFAAAALAQYGQGPWGTKWGVYPQQGSGVVSTNGALKVQVSKNNADQYSGEWASPNGKKICRIHVKGESERNYDYGYVYGWNGSSWVLLAKRCSPSPNAEYDEWVDVSAYNVTKLKTRLTTDGSVLYNPTYVDVVEVDIGSAQSSSSSVPSNGALRIQVNYHRADVYSGEWAPPTGGKILKIHMRGESERNYDYGYVYGWNGSSWVQLAKECSSSSNTEYDKWIDVSSYNVTKLKTRLTTDGSVLYNPTYVDVPEVVTDAPNTSTSPFDSNTWWIWGQGGAVKCAPNGQEVQLSKSCFLYYNATYDAYAVADDHFKIQLTSQDYSDPNFLSGDATWVGNVAPASHKSLCVSKSSGYPNPGQCAAMFTANAWNDYGPAGFIFALRHTGWRWSSSFTPQYSAWGWFHYPGWSVSAAQWVSVTVANQSGQAVNIYIDDWTNEKNSVTTGYGTCNFYAYPGITYSVCLNSSTLYNTVVVSYSGGETAVRTDSAWQYAPVDGVMYGSVTLPATVQPGAALNAQIQVTNTGHKEWYGTAVPSWWPTSYGRGITALSYHWYDQSGNLVVQDGLRTAYPDVVNPNTSTTRTMSVQAPSAPGTYRLMIDSVQEDVAWFGPLQGVNWPTVEANIVVAGRQRDVYFNPVAIPKYMVAAQTYTIRVTATNKGTETWFKSSSYRLGYYWLDNNGKKAGEGACILPSDVRTGESVTVDLGVTAPNKPGTYTLVISMATATQNGFSWWCEDPQCPCPYLKASVEVPDGDVLQGTITFDGEDYWIGTTLLDSQGPDLSAFAGRDAIVWGNETGQKQSVFFITSIQEYFPNDWTAAVTFDPNKDVLCNDPVAGDPDAPAGDPVGQPRTDGYAYCRVTYHYPVPLRKFWEALSNTKTPIWRGSEPPSKSLVGEAFFVSGETGEQ